MQNVNVSYYFLLNYCALKKCKNHWALLRRWRHTSWSAVSVSLFFRAVLSRLTAPHQYPAYHTARRKSARINRSVLGNSRVLAFSEAINKTFNLSFCSVVWILKRFCQKQEISRYQFSGEGLLNESSFILQRRFVAMTTYTWKQTNIIYRLIR